MTQLHSFSLIYFYFSFYFLGTFSKGSFYTSKNMYATPIKTIDARKLHTTRLPKNILFPSKLEIGIILKKANQIFNLANIGNPRK